MRRKFWSLAQILILLPTVISFGSLLPRDSSGATFKTLFTVKSYLPNRPFKDPQGLFLDEKKGEIYIADTGNNEIDIFDLQGFPLFQFGHEKGLASPIDLVVDGEGRIYVSQMAKGHVEVYNYRGELVAQVPPHGQGLPGFAPGRLALDGAGNLYVADRKGKRVVIFGRDGKYRTSFGGRGREEGNFELIAGLAVNGEGRVYVSDSRAIPLQVFDARGLFLLATGRHGPAREDFSFPAALTLDRDGRVWIVDSFRHSVKVLSPTGGLLFQFGSFGIEPGQLFFPVDIALDSRGRVYILEKGAGRLQVWEQRP